MVSGRAQRGVRRTMGGEGIGQINARALCDPCGVAADLTFRVLHPFSDGEKAALHLERGAGAGSAKVFGRLGQDGVGVIQRLACEQQFGALGKHLAAMPFEPSEVVPALGPVGLEAGDGADALQAGDEIEERDEPGDEHSEGREPAVAGRVGRLFVRVRLELHAGIITPLEQVWDARVWNCLN